MLNYSIILYFLYFRKFLRPLGINIADYAIFYAPEFYQCGFCKKTFDRSQICIHTDMCQSKNEKKLNIYNSKDYSRAFTCGRNPHYIFQPKVVLQLSWFAFI